MTSNDNSNGLFNSIIGLGKMGLHLGINASKMAINKVSDPQFQGAVKENVSSMGLKIKEVRL